MNIFPAPGFLLIEILSSDTTSDGIYRADEDKSSPRTAKVVAVGRPKLDGKDSIEVPTFPDPLPKSSTEDNPHFSLKQGDTIYFIRGGDRPLPAQSDKKLSFLPFEHVLALVTEEDKK